MKNATVRTATDEELRDAWRALHPAERHEHVPLVDELHRRNLLELVPCWHQGQRWLLRPPEEHRPFLLGWSAVGHP